MAAFRQAGIVRDPNTERKGAYSSGILGAPNVLWAEDSIYGRSLGLKTLHFHTSVEVAAGSTC